MTDEKEKTFDERFDNLTENIIVIDEKIALYSAIGAILHIVSHLVKPEDIQNCPRLAEDEVLKEAAGLFTILKAMQFSRKAIEKEAINEILEKIIKKSGVTDSDDKIN